MIRGTVEGHSEFLGVNMLQNGLAIPAFNELFEQLKSEGKSIARIIEIGTSHGGLTILLGLYCKIKGIPCITYEINDIRDKRVKELFELLNIEFRLVNCFDDPRLLDDVKGNGITLLLCDGGDKPREVNTFAPHLKVGDIIMSHDYCTSLEHFQGHMYNNFWNWCEISDDKISIENFEPYMQDTFANAAWLCKIKIA